MCVLRMESNKNKTGGLNLKSIWYKNKLLRHKQFVIIILSKVYKLYFLVSQ